MAKYQKQIPGLDFTNLAGLISGFLESAAAARDGEEQADENAHLTCPNCGTDLRHVPEKRHARLRQCYQAFRKPLEGLLMRVHGNTQHAGRITRRRQKRRFHPHEHRPFASGPCQGHRRGGIRGGRALRDQIRALKQQLEPAEKADSAQSAAERGRRTMTDFVQAPEQDVVISSRVRLARNYQDLPFSPKLTREAAEQVISRAQRR